MDFVHDLSFNDTISGYLKSGIPVIEDVIIDHSHDGTSATVTLCGPYGWELVTETIADAELQSLKNDLKDCNFIIESSALPYL